MSPRALSPKDAITLFPALGCVGSLANLRSLGRGPKYHKCGRKVIYRVEDLEAYLFSTPVLTRDSVELGR